MIALLLAAALVQTAPGANALAGAYGNTIVSTYPDGRTARLWLEPDGRFTGTTRSGRQTAGVWILKGDEVCMRLRRPVPIPKAFCTPVVEGGVGTTWAAKAVTGEDIRVTVVAGR